MDVVLSEIVVTNTEGEPLEVGANPVGYGGQSGQPVDGGQGQRVGRDHSRRGEHGPVSIEQCLPGLWPDGVFTSRQSLFNFLLLERIAMVSANRLRHLLTPAKIGAGSRR
ncbi:hypothetical protein D3C85_1552090 [compost metagenome]